METYRVTRICPKSGQRTAVTVEDFQDVLPSCADVLRLLAWMAKTGRTRVYGGFYWDAALAVR